MADLTGMMQAAAGAAGGGATGSYIAVGTSNGYMTLLDHTTPGSLSLAATYISSNGIIRCRFSPDGNYIGFIRITTNPTFTLLNHSAGSVSLATTYNASGAVQGLSFSPDGNYIRVGTTLLDHSTPGSLSYLNTTGGDWGSDFSPDGNYLAASGNVSPDWSLLLYSRPTPSTLSLASQAAIGTANPSVAFSPDSNYIAYAAQGTNFSGGIPNLNLYYNNAGSLTQTATYVGTGFGRSVDFSPDGNYIALGLNSLVLLNHSAGSISLATTYTTSGAVVGARFSPDGNYLAITRFNVSPYFVLLDHTTPGSLSLAATYTLAGAGQLTADLDWSPN